MIDEAFTLGLALVFFFILAWGFKALPSERWQILAAVPRRRHPDGAWQGENLTFYGRMYRVRDLADWMLQGGATRAELDPPAPADRPEEPR